MSLIKRAPVLALGVIALTGCMKSASSEADTPSVAAAQAATDAGADEKAIRAINPAWFKAYNAHDADALTALYADDAIVNAPGSPAARGREAIRELFRKDVQGSAAAGITNNQGPNPEFAVSGDLGHEWNTFTISDKAGKTVDKGKYVSVYGRRNGKWMIIRDIWNSDMPATPAR
jgi:uncharacterized protein (TIGR02246 family)